ncbi:TPA: DUF2164 family protein [Escherichia coli]|nr:MULTISPECIES: DUF2164 family protein [Enterobacteriaceae]EEV8268906.1 DUF2164 family protein [Escherichia coli]EEV8269600.1 DUF2164 family protein [Escherichia coli]EFZ7365150.1 DUF2164 family protein [Shigella sonnei]EFZ7367350.1 DUF2164 family protein [Shigella sonnei]MDF1141784.1 DUF2164 family protein [Escherichia coli]
MILSFFITVIPGHDKPQPPGCLLDEILKRVIPAIYNVAIDDAIKSVRNVGDRLEEELDMRKVV